MWSHESGYAWVDAEGDDADALLWLHDADGEPPTEDDAATIRRLGLRAIAPLAGPTWWTDDATIDAAIKAARSRWGVAPRAVMGIGGGGHAALRLTYRRPREFPVAAAWRPAIDCHRLLAPGASSAPARDELANRYRDAEHARQDSAVLHIHPLNWPPHQRFDCPPGDPWWEGADRLRMKLTSLGVPHEADLESPTTDGRVTQLVAWAAERLAIVRRAVR